MEKKKVDLDFLVKDLDDREIPGSNAGKILANILVSKTSGDTLKLFNWAIDLHRSGKLELDESDFNTLKGEVEGSSLPILTKAQIIKKLAKDNPKE